MDGRPSEFALGFGERRLEDALGSISRISPALSASVRASSGSGDPLVRMRRASDALRAAAEGIRKDGKADKAIESELRRSLGKSYSKTNVLAMLTAHAEGLLALSTPAGLGGAIFLHEAEGFRKRLIETARVSGADEAAADSALGHLDSWVRSLLLGRQADDPDDPVLMLSSCEDEASAARWAGKLIARCVHGTDDEVVKSLISEALHSWLGGRGK